MDVTVTDASARHRYEAYVAARLAGYVRYRLDGPVITLLHTEVEPEYAGKGVGGALIRGVLD